MSLIISTSKSLSSNHNLILMPKRGQHPVFIIDLSIIQQPAKYYSRITIDTRSKILDGLYIKSAILNKLPILFIGNQHIFCIFISSLFLFAAFRFK